MQWLIHSNFYRRLFDQVLEDGNYSDIKLAMWTDGSGDRP